MRQITLAVIMLFCITSYASPQVSKGNSDTTAYLPIATQPDKPRVEGNVRTARGESFNTCHDSATKIYVQIRGSESSPEDYIMRWNTDRDFVIQPDACSLSCGITDDKSHLDNKSFEKSSPAFSFKSSADTIHVRFRKAGHHLAEVCRCEYSQVDLPVKPNANYELTLYPSEAIVYFSFVSEDQRESMANDVALGSFGTHIIDLNAFYLNRENGKIRKGEDWWQSKSIEDLTLIDFAFIDTLTIYKDKNGKQHTGLELIGKKSLSRKDFDFENAFK